MNKKSALVIIAIVAIAYLGNLWVEVNMFNAEAGLQFGWRDEMDAYYYYYEFPYFDPGFEIALSGNSWAWNLEILRYVNWNGEDDPRPYMDIVSLTFKAFGNGRSITISTEEGGSVTFVTSVKGDTTVFVYNIWWGPYIREPNG